MGMLDFDRNAPLTELLSVSRNAALAQASEAELSALAMHCRERYVERSRTRPGSGTESNACWQKHGRPLSAPHSLRKPIRRQGDS